VISRWTVRAAAVTVVCIGFGACAHTSTHRMTRSIDRSAIDSLFKAYDGAGVPGAGVLVVEDGKEVLARSFGMADLEAHIAADEQTNYRLASLTKQFTATAVLLLVKDGRLALDDRVRDILPELPAYTSDVRIRHLLTHTSGLWAYEDFVPDSQTTQVHDRDVPALFQHAESLYFSPGSAYRYSNTGYALLALVIERRSGLPFARFLNERIFQPLGMRSTLAYEAGVSAVPHRAFGYSASGDTFSRTDQSSTSAVLGDGGVYSSLHDLAIWDRALDSRVLLGERAQQEAWTAARLNDGTPIRYGFGWFVDNAGEDLRVSHHGETMGFTNFILKYPRRRLTVIVLSNRTGGNPWDLAADVARLFTGTAGGGR
jgi:CubicO group peptidase (beta-lactamase class C family)